MTTTFAAPAVRTTPITITRKYLVMKSNDGQGCDYLKTPDAFAVEIDQAFMEFLKHFTDGAAPFIRTMKDHGFCKTELHSALFGDWLCVKADQEEQWELFWKKVDGTAQIVDELPDFLIVAHEAGVSIEAQILACDDPKIICFKASLYDGSVEAYTDDVELAFIAQAIGYRSHQAALSKYVADPTRCPVCEAENIWTDQGDFTVSEDGQIAASKTVCKSCGASWEDNYRICGYQNLVKGE